MRETKEVSVEATKTKAPRRTALLILAALSMLMSGLFVANASRADASPPPACPDGFSLTADEKNCFQAAVVTSADNPNSCSEGQLTPDGSTCYVEASILPQEGSTLCPSGFSPDDSLGGMCARFESASQRDADCPDGARGEAGGCYILVAKGPVGDAECTEGTLVGTNCVITGAAPVNGASTCPVSATVLEDNGECYTLIAPPVTAGSCDAAYFAFGSVCKANNTGTDQATVVAFTCPAPATGETVTENMHTTDGITKVESCEYAPASSAGDCPTGTTVDPNGVDCRRPVDLRPGAQQCVDGFGLVDGRCIRYVAPITDSAQCPAGSVEDTVGDCRKPVADASGAYYCSDANAALNGTSCVFTAGFLIDPAPSLYQCTSGDRSVIGSGDTTQVVCLLGAADENTTSGPSCLQGVLSTDNAYCLVPRIDTAPVAAVSAPVPSFTG
jgi:hypothetical protein